MGRDRHPKKDIESALRYAESHGWKVQQKKSKKSHTWGRVTSPDGGISIRVDGTPKNPSDRAKDVRRAVDRYERDRETEEN